ncbi:MAG: AAA family ATPase [Clostridia bacterium]|nr:AAA family ATPase [Clostridia bacterium]
MAPKCYLRSLKLVSAFDEIEYIKREKRVANSMYPFKMFDAKELRRVDFEPITILCGSNGSGKTTLLNVIAEAAGLHRHSPFHGGMFFADYVSMCKMDADEIPRQSQILTSDDISDYLINMRALNNGIDNRRNELYAEYIARRDDLHRNLTSLEDYDDWKESMDAKSKTPTQFIKARMMKSVDMFSNGETAMKYYLERISENALYLIDEPENSLSPKLQRDLLDYISASARYYGCQFIIATHSPILLSLPGAKIYDLDDYPVSVKKWTELEHVCAYYSFFKQHEEEILAANPDRRWDEDDG